MSEARDVYGVLLGLVVMTRGHFERVCGEFGISPPQGHALRELAPGRVVAMSELAGCLRCDASNVTVIADRLEERGLVERRVSESDRRVKTLVVTEKGRELREKFVERLGDAPPEVAELSEGDLRDLRKLLEKVVSAQDLRPKAGVSQ